MIIAIVEGVDLQLNISNFSRHDSRDSRYGERKGIRLISNETSKDYSMKELNAKALLTVGMLAFSSYSVANENVMQVMTNENTAVSQIMFFSDESPNDYVLKSVNTFSHVAWTEYFDSEASEYKTKLETKGLFKGVSVVPLADGRSAHVCFNAKVPENYSTRVYKSYVPEYLEVTNDGYCMTAPLQGGWVNGERAKFVDVLVTFE